MKIKRFMLIFFTILFTTASISIIYCAFVLTKYTDAHIDDELIDAICSCKETCFYCFDSKLRMNNVYEQKKLKHVNVGSGIRYRFVEYDIIPADLKNAFTAIEDRRFYEHNGIDYRRTLSAALNYLVRQKTDYGGSTITQQLVKNLTGNDKKSIDRKLSEAFCAMALERDHDKSEILEVYLNIINLSNGCRGVGAAAEFYFSKSVDELSLCESAAIAAITNNPSKYDPIKHPNENLKRRSVILKCMLDLGYISELQYAGARNEKLLLNIADNKTEKYNSWYVDAAIEDVIDDLSAQYGITKQNASVLLYQGGYNVYLAMDMQIQDIMESYFENELNFPKDKNQGSPNASMIIIDPNTGDILGLIGNRGIKNGDRIQNFATKTKRPPGSAIKPLSVYAPAIDKGLINWSTLIEDSPITTDITKGTAWPSNSNNKYLGKVTVKQAISTSINTVPVKILHELGNSYAFDFLTDQLAISSLDPNSDMGDASLALGQPSYGITLRELTAAYSIFQNGIMSKSRTYYKVTDSNGRVILDNASKQNRAISNETASIMTKLLQTVISDGTASGYDILSDSIEVAGKTGTTQHSFDKYFIGYTPSLLAGVWHGYEYPKTIDCFNGNYSICIWDDVMRRIYAQTDYSNEKTKFKVSSNVRESTYTIYDDGITESEDIQMDLEKGWFNIKDKYQCNK